MKNSKLRPGYVVVAFAAVLLFISSTNVHAKIDGLTGTTFNFTAKTDYISTADGGSMMIWGLSDDSGSTNGRAQYPAPTLIVNQGSTITVNLKNEIAVSTGNVPNISLVFPGHEVTETCTPGNAAPDTCPQGDLAMEAENDGDTVSYSFLAEQPGTYTYSSGTNPGLQVEMGITGAIIVRPVGFGPNARTAYGLPETAFDYEQLFFLTEMDPNIHLLVELYGPDHPDIQPLLDHYFSNYWFINGRTAPDDLAQPFAGWLPTQPYNSTPRMHPGDILLMRVVGGGRDMHPFHHHGNHALVIARDGRMLESAPGTGPDIATQGFTITGTPGKTVDALFHWTGEGLNWDIYGGSDLWAQGLMIHDCTDGNGDNYDDTTHEYCPDHGKPFPVVLPGNLELTFGGWWGGSPYLGTLDALPPGEGGLNPNGGFSFMWHSHTEKELTNWDIFPGGMLTMMIIEPPGVPIEQ